MKKIFLFLGIILSFASCSIDDDERTTFVSELVPVVSVEAPDSLVFRGIDTLKITYNKPTTCHVFRGFQTDKKGDTIYIGVVNDVYVQESCEPLTDENKVVPLIFRIEENRDSYFFKFWKGKDEDGKSIFSETIEIPVKVR